MDGDKYCVPEIRVPEIRVPEIPGAGHRRGRIQVRVRKASTPN